MSAQIIASTLGWLILVASFVIPKYLGKNEAYFENEKNAYLMGLALSAFATGIFLANTLHSIFN